MACFRYSEGLDHYSTNWFCFRDVELARPTSELEGISLALHISPL